MAHERGPGGRCETCGPAMPPCRAGTGLHDGYHAIAQVIPVTGAWEVRVTEQSTDYAADGIPSSRHKGDTAAWPVIGWALMADGDVEPLFCQPGGTVASVSEYRHMNHECGPLDEAAGGYYSVVHNIEVAQAGGREAGGDG